MYLKIFDGNGTEVFALYGGNPMSKNFQYVSFGGSKNITIQVSLIDSWSFITINYGIMKQRLDLGKEKKKNHFSQLSKRRDGFHPCITFLEE